MKVTSRNGQRTVRLESAERKVLEKAMPILNELADLADEDAAAKCAVTIGGLVGTYSAEVKAAATK